MLCRTSDMNFQKYGLYRILHIGFGLLERTWGGKFKPLPLHRIFFKPAQSSGHMLCGWMRLCDWRGIVFSGKSHKSL